MLPHLELVPRDVLEHIAFLVVLSPEPTPKPPQDLLHLLLTSSTLYYSLCTTSAPSLYANIFRSTFDAVPDAHNATDSLLTAELVSRFRLLRRVRRRELQLSDQTLHEDLCVAMRTVIESTGVNEAHLRSSRFSDFIFAYVQRCLKESQTRLSCNMDLAVWLLVLTWTRDDVARLSDENRGMLLDLLRPLISISSGLLPDVRPRMISKGSNSYSSTYSAYLTKSERQLLRSKQVCPSASSAAIILNFILLETGSIQELPQSPFSDRATNSNTTGPTLKDYYTMAKYQTALFSDDCPFPDTTSFPTHLSRTVKHDPQFLDAKSPASDAYYLLPDLITGIWEGVYMVSCSDTNKDIIPDAPDFVCKMPLQCSLVLFFCFAEDFVPKCIQGDVDQWPVMPRDFSTEGKCLEISGKKTCYEKFGPSVNRSGCPGLYRDYSRALDCLVIGQTTEDHGRAWGSFNFAGRLKRDGTIVMKRGPKNPSDDGLGTWIFEGNLRYGAAFVGTWRSGISSDSGIRGLFSLSKRLGPPRLELGLD